MINVRHHRFRKLLPVELSLFQFNMGDI